MIPSTDNISMGNNVECHLKGFIIQVIISKVQELRFTFTDVLKSKFVEVRDVDTNVPTKRRNQYQQLAMQKGINKISNLF